MTCFNKKNQDSKQAIWWKFGALVILWQFSICPGNGHLAWLILNFSKCLVFNFGTVKLIKIFTRISQLPILCGKDFLISVPLNIIKPQKQ
jgi:hypothetical protein